jgi:hypothetical protein
MPEDSCPSCGNVYEYDVLSNSATGQWQIDGSVLTTELPDELGSLLGQFLGTTPIDTLSEWVASVHHHIDGPSLTINELCLTDEQTDHWGMVDGEHYYFACFYDAVILAALVDSPVDIQTKSPGGTVIEARAVSNHELTAAPDGAVFSFGIHEEVSPPSDGESSVEAGYSAICPYVRAFPTIDAYKQWAARVPAATISMPLAGATELAAGLVDDSPK